MHQLEHLQGDQGDEEHGGQYGQNCLCFIGQQRSHPPELAKRTTRN